MTAPIAASRFGHTNPELRRPLESDDAAEPFITLPPLPGFAASRRRMEAAIASVATPEAGGGSGGWPPPASISPPDLPAAESHDLAGPTLPGLGPDGSLALLLRRRMQQVEKGYTPDADANLPIGWLLKEALRYGADAQDWLQRPNADPDRAHYENKLIAMGALVMAELDRLHATRADKQGQAQR